jgi:hypothetical protein
MGERVVNCLKRREEKEEKERERRKKGRGERKRMESNANKPGCKRKPICSEFVRDPLQQVHIYYLRNKCN